MDRVNLAEMRQQLRKIVTSVNLSNTREIKIQKHEIGETSLTFDSPKNIPNLIIEGQELNNTGRNLEDVTFQDFPQLQEEFFKTKKLCKNLNREIDFLATKEKIDENFESLFSIVENTLFENSEEFL